MRSPLLSWPNKSPVILGNDDNVISRELKLVKSRLKLSGDIVHIRRALAHEGQAKEKSRICRFVQRGLWIT